MAEHRHRTGRRAALALVPAVVGMSGCNREPPDPRGLRLGETLLSVAATGRAEAVPDQALFTVGLSSIAPSAQAAGAGNAQIMARIIAALAKLNIPERDLQTRDVSLSRIDYGRNRGKFEASNTVAVRVRDVRQAGAAIAAVTAAGANIVSGPDLSLSDPEKASLGAYGAAYRAARAKAEAYADAANLRIARVLSIRDGGEGARMAPMGEEAARDMVRPMAAPPPVLAGTNASIVTTSVDFVLAPK